MIRLFILVLCCLAAAMSGMAQRKAGGDGYFTGTEHGLYIEFNDVASARAGLTIGRQGKGDTGFVTIGYTAHPASSADFYRRMSEVVGWFPGYSLPAKELADSLWQVWNGPEAPSLLGERSPVIHLALGLAFLDTAVVAGEPYTYRFVQRDDGTASESERVVYDQEVPVFSPMTSTVVDVGESRPHLEWQAAQVNGATQFDAWRRVSGASAGFDRLFTASGVVVSAQGDSLTYLVTDTTALVGVQYDYFLSGRDIFGNMGTTSDTVTLQVGGRRNIEAAFGVQTQAVDNGIRLYWDPLEQRYSLQNIVILRSAVYDGGYDVIATVPVTDTAYIDGDILGGRNYYYQLLVQGASNFSLASPRVSGIYQGIVQLLPPQHLEGEDTPDGGRLSWYYADTTNLRGFYVYRTWSTTAPLEQVGGLLPPGDGGLNTFIDTARLAGATHAYYTVAAVSTTQSLSPPAEVVEVQRAGNPESVRLAAPSRLRPLWLSDTTVSLTWLDVLTRSENVMAYRVYRKDSEDAAFGEVPWLETDLNEAVDTLSGGKQRWYAVRSVDANGTESGWSPVVAVVAPLRPPLAPGSVRLTARAEGMLVSWDTDGEGSKIRSYRVYRAEATGDAERIADVKPDDGQQNFLDKSTKSGNRYYYYVTGIDDRGVESGFSAEVSMTMP